MFELIQPFAIAFLIGLFIGIERERSHPAGSQSMGVRTFTILALLGAVAAWLNELVIAIGLTFFAFSAILIGYFRSTQSRKKTRGSIGLTTEFSAAAVFCLGYITPKNPLLAAILGGAVLLVLLGRESLHRFSREKLTQQEIQAAVMMLIATVGVLPFLPNHPIDPWLIFNPRRFGILVILIATLQFGGYVAIRLLGQRLGMMLLGFFGGLISSTAVFATLPKLVKARPELTNSAVIAAILSTVGMLTEFTIIVFIAAPKLLLALIWPVVLMLITGIILTLVFIHNGKTGEVIPKKMNPLEIKSVLRLALMIGGAMIIVAFTQHYFGARGVQLFALFGGLFELHSVSLATAMLSLDGKLPFRESILTIATALFASFVSKYGLLWTLAKDRFAMLTSVFLTIMLAVGFVSFFLQVYPHL